MKVFVKTLKGSVFEIEATAQDKIADLKKNIGTAQGADVYPAAQQMLIHQGKVLKDETTLEENNVAEGNFIIIMLSKAQPASNTSPPTQLVTAPTSASAVAPLQPSIQTAPAPIPAPAPLADVYGQATSNLAAGGKLEATIQQIIDMGGGSWDRDTVVRALRAAYNNPERAVGYLYSVSIFFSQSIQQIMQGIPEMADAVLPVDQPPAVGQQVNPTTQPLPTSAGPNANPLDLFPQGVPYFGGNAGGGNLDFFRNNPQFQALRAMVQSNPQILQPMLQELGKQNPQLVRMIQEHQGDFLRLINEPGTH